MLGVGVSLFSSLPTLRSREPTSTTVNPGQSKTTPGDVACNDEIFHAGDDGDLQKALISLNESMMIEIQHELRNAASWADLTSLFIRWSRVYPSIRRRLIQKRSLKSQDCKDGLLQLHTYLGPVKE